MPKKITIDPVTRLEGHGKIEIFLNDDGNVDKAYFQIPELRGFEKFVEGRPAEDMPQITSRICGVCPSAHHMASTKALDSLYGVEPPLTARLIRQVFYDLFMYEDHLLHFFFLGGPDFIVGPDAPKAQRNILGVIDKVGVETGKKVIATRSQARALMEALGGKVIHPVLGLPGGVAKPMSKDVQQELKRFAREAVGFAQFALQAFHTLVVENKNYVEMILSEGFTQKTYYMGLVDERNQINFYDGHLRIMTPGGQEWKKFHPKYYQQVLSEHVEPWSYIKFPYLKDLGWHGFFADDTNGLYRVAPLARLNATEGMPTPLAQAEYERFYDTLGGKPIHHTLAIHWARLIETLYAAEHLVILADQAELLGDHIRNMDLQPPREGIGVVEAPRGTLIHHYTTDDQGLMKTANLIVASQHNSAAMCLAIEQSARALIHDGVVNDGLLNKIEMAFRAFDPCFGCATHCLPGKLPLAVSIKNHSGQNLMRLLRDHQGVERTLTDKS